MRWLLVVLVSGCAGLTYSAGPFEIKRCSETFYVYEAGLDPDELDQVRRGFAYWNGAIGRALWYDGGAVANEVDPAESYVIVRYVDSLDDGDGVCGDTSYSWRVDGCMTHTVIKLARSCAAWSTEAAKQTVVRHEIGHALGLRHSKARDDLMYPEAKSYGDASKEASARERAAVRELYR